MKRILLLFCLLAISISGYTQSSISIETQAYPAGFIYGLNIDIELRNNLLLNSGFAYNRTNRQDWGVKDNEEGDGFGLHIGFEKKNLLINNLSVQFRSDLWNLDIDWSNLEELPDQTCEGSFGSSSCFEFKNGTTSITVLQPTIGLGYLIAFRNRSHIKPTLSFGYEINVKTDGESVGEGAILLGGFQFGFSL